MTLLHHNRNRRDPTRKVFKRARKSPRLSIRNLLEGFIMLGIGSYLISILSSLPTSIKDPQEIANAWNELIIGIVKISQSMIVFATFLLTIVGAIAAILLLIGGIWRLLRLLSRNMRLINLPPRNKRY